MRAAAASERVKESQQPRPETMGSKNITDSKELIIISLTKFFGNKQHLKLFLDHVAPASHAHQQQQESPPTTTTTTTTSVDKPKETSTKATSLRIIDWFVTNYAKKHPITLKTDDGMHFNVYINYRSQLKAYSKHQFDPFRRRFRINYYYDKDKFVETTIGQLNFFKWLIEYNVLAYIQAHHEEIESDMTSSQLKPRDAVSAASAVVGEGEVDVDAENDVDEEVEEAVDEEVEKKNKTKGCGGDEPNRVPHQHQRMNKVDGVRRLVFS